MSTSTLASDTRVTDRVALDRAVAVLASRRRAEVEVLEAALAWAHAHVVSPDADPGEVAGWRSDTVRVPGTAAALFGERPLPLAGVGTPLVAEFCVMELAAALDLSHEATLALLGDVLDLAHRLPRVWGLVRALRVPAHLGPEAARESRDLSLAAAGHADRLLAWQPRRLNPHRIGVLVHEARLYADDKHGVARSPELGAVLVGRLRSWLLMAGTVTIKPVVDLDPGAHPPVDAHDPPARMAAMVRLRDETCVYPRCGRLAMAWDLDHIVEYVPLSEGGPPGQTRPANLAPLCRRHHRAKTFGDSTYRRLGDGSYEWTLPTGTRVTTDPPGQRPRP